MQQKKTTDYECHYPSVAEDSTYHYTNCNWQYADSLRTHYAKYKDSVAVDYDMNKMKYTYVHVDHKDSWKGAQQDQQDLTTHDLQYWMVPGFFSLMIIMIIFATVK